MEKVSFLIFTLLRAYIHISSLENSYVLIRTILLSFSWINDTENWIYDVEGLPLLCGNLTGARHCPTGKSLHLFFFEDLLYFTQHQNHPK